jgi:hypothetical protein
MDDFLRENKVSPAAVYAFFELREIDRDKNRDRDDDD